MMLKDLLSDTTQRVRLFAHIHAASPSTANWMIVDGRPGGDRALLMHRPWIADSGRRSQGCVVGFDRADDLSVLPGCGLVLISPGEAMSDQELELWESATREKRERHRIVAHRDNWTQADDLDLENRAEPSDPLVAVPLTVMLHGQVVQRVRTTLPFTFTVSSRWRWAQLSVEIDEGGFRFAGPNQYVVSTTDDSPIGACTLVLDAEPRPSGPDRLTLSTPTPNRRLQPDKLAKARRRFGRWDHVNLHVLID